MEVAERERMATVWKLNTGMQVSTDAITLSPDGKTLTIHTKGIKATGGTGDDTTVYERVAGTSGLVGKWKTKNVKSTSPAMMELVLSGKDGISFRFPDIDITCDAKFDGKDVTCTRAGAAHPYSLAVVEGDRRTIAATFKISGKMVSKSSYAVSTDGKTLTETGVSANGEKVMTVYDRQ
jgi:hypothetical protein